MMNLFDYSRFFVFCLALITSFVASLPLETINKDIVVKNVDRSLDLSTQLAKFAHEITIENSGKNPVKSFLFVIERQLKDNVAYVDAQSGAGKVVEVKVNGHDDKRFYRVDLKEPLASSKTVTVHVEAVFTYVLSPYPISITQKERQYVRFRGNHYIFSPYTVNKQTTTVNLGTRTVESYSKLAPVSQSDTTFTYGPYVKTQPFSEDAMVIHFENNSPFLSVTSLERVIEVSHWGNIAVEEDIHLFHTGAKLKGPFSRYEYQREAHSGVSSIKSFKTVLPAAATDAYYRDEIGNISTSHMRVLSDSVELDLRPRFPLFGGWKTHYVLGYSVPSYEYLYNSGDDYKLKMRLVDHVYDDMVIDDAVTKVILPEGSHNVQLVTPYTVHRLPDSLHYTYLDTKGRLVVSVSMKNLVEHHIQDFELSYVFPRILMLQEPLLVVGAFYLLFLLVIIYVRLDFCISKDEASESKLRVSGICDKILAHQDKRADTYNALDSALTKLKQNKDVYTFSAVAKNINQDYKNETSNIADLLVKLKLDAPELAEKIFELQKADKNLKELYTQQQSMYVDKLLPGKLCRTSFVSLENTLNKKKEDLEEKINNIIKSLN